MQKYTKRPDTDVEAVVFTKESVPEIQALGLEVTFAGKGHPRLAADEPRHAETKCGTPALPGQYVVKHSCGRICVMNKRDFEAAYEPAAEKPKARKKAEEKAE